MSSSPSSPTALAFGGALAFAVFVIGFQVLLAKLGLTEVLHGALPDGDNYLWLVRVRQYLDGGSWASSIITGMDTPYGLDMHWTHPLDIFILALYAPLSLFMPMDSALFWAGASVPVLLFLIFSAALYWAVRPLLPRGEAFILLFLSLAYPVLMAYSMLGRADHNYLILTSMVLAVGGMIRLLHPPAPQQQPEQQQLEHQQPEQHRACIITAAACALGIWVSTEFAPLLAFFIASLAMAWLLTGQAKWLRHVFILSGCLLIFSALALSVERGPSLWQAQQLDKLSLIHVVALSINAALWALAYALLSRKPMALLARTACLSGLGIAALVLIWQFTPALLRGPMGDIDPAVNAYLYEVTGELSSIWPTSFERAATACLWVGPALLALMLWWLSTGLASTTNRTAVWYFLTALVLAYSLAGLMHARFAQMALPFTSLFLVHAALSIQQRCQRKSPLLLLCIILAPILLCYGLSAFFDKLAKQQDDASPTPANFVCIIEDMIPTLQQLPAGRIMNDINAGPAILYNTKHSVVAGAYHRNDQGIADVLAFSRGPATTATALLKKRDIDYVLFCVNERQGDYARQLATQAQDNTIPNWLKPLPVPATLDKHWFLFKVTKENLP